MKYTYHNWPEKTLSVSRMRLDPENPRLALEDKLNQSKLIEELVTYDNIWSLAKNIVENGFFPHELMIVIKEENHFYVVEGNRRLTALKLLLDPTKAPKTKQSSFKSLSKQIDHNHIKKIKVLVAPSRAEADRIIFSKHTNPDIKTWKPLMKAKYIQRLLSEGLSEGEITREFNLTPSDINSSLLLINFSTIIREMEIPEDIEFLVRNERKFPFTTFMRHINHPKMQSFLGVCFLDMGTIEIQAEKADFEKAFIKFLTDITVGDFNPKKVNSAKDFEKYITPLMADYGAVSKANNPTIVKNKEYTSSNKNSNQNTKQEPKKRKKRTVKPKGLIPKDFEYNVSNQKIKYVIGELQDIDVEKFSIATGILLRVLLDTGLAHYFNETGHYEILKEKTKKKQPNKPIPKEHVFSLHDMLVHSISDEGFIKDPALIKVVKNLNDARKDSEFSIESLNLVAHNQYHVPTKPILEYFWNNLMPLFEVILIDPEDEEDRTDQD